MVDQLLESLRSAMDCAFGCDKAVCSKLIGHLKQINRSLDVYVRVVFPTIHVAHFILLQAAVLLLDYRTRLLTIAVDTVKADGSVSLYAKKKCDLFFAELVKTKHELRLWDLDENAKNRSGRVLFATVLSYVGADVNSYC